MANPNLEPNDKKSFTQEEKGNLSGKINPDVVRLEFKKGSRLGDTYAKVKGQREFHRVGAGHFIAIPEADVPHDKLQRVFRKLKRLFIGRPLLFSEEPAQRLGVFKALAVFGSDAISSSAYATEAAMVILVVAGNSALKTSFLLALTVSIVLIIVSFSYRQTVQAYPQGGGSYTVSHENLGRIPGLIAASALLIDYILTVAVSIVAGVQAIISALFVAGYGDLINGINDGLPLGMNVIVILSLLFIALMILANLRGVRESGTIFAIPTYLFIFGFFIMLIIGIFKAFNGTLQAATLPPILPITQTLSLWLILRAFSSGAVAMTGIEAVSNGVTALKPPEPKNAAKTLILLASLLGIFYIGLSYLVVHMGLVPGSETIISQTALAVFGHNVFYYVFQIATMGILVVAANTAFADFPRLSSVLAKDGYMPHQFQFRGDRLTFSTGIVALGVMAALLVFIFKGNVSSLINLYAIGVFLAFSLSGSGMVVHWHKTRGPGWKRYLLINGLAAILTASVLIIVVFAKFLQGGWIVVILSPLIVVALLTIKRHYGRVRDQLQIETQHLPSTRLDQLAILPIEDVNYASLRAMSFLRSIQAERVVIHVSTSSERAEKIKQKMQQYAPDLKLVIIESPTVSFIQPMITYVNAVHQQYPKALVTIVFPEFIAAHWWERFLHNRTARRLFHTFETHPNVVVVMVPYLLEK